MSEGWLAEILTRDSPALEEVIVPSFERYGGSEVPACRISSDKEALSPVYVE